MNLMYGKAKQQRTIQTGLNKADQETDKDKIDLIQQTLELSDEEMEKRDWKNLENYVINTVDSIEEAGKTVAMSIEQESGEWADYVRSVVNS